MRQQLEPKRQQQVQRREPKRQRLEQRRELLQVLLQVLLQEQEQLLLFCRKRTKQLQR